MFCQCEMFWLWFSAKAPPSVPSAVASYFTFTFTQGWRVSHHFTSSRMKTRFTRLFPSCTVPIMGAPMAGVSGGLLASETCRAGALGSIGAGHHNTESEAECLEGEVERFRKETASTTSSSPPLVVGFICHSTFNSEDGWRLTEEFLSRHKPAAVQYFAPAVVKREPGDKGGFTNIIDLAKRYGCRVIT